jgi:hypothetical protein
MMVESGVFDFWNRFDRFTIRGENNVRVIGEVEAVTLEEGLSRAAAFCPQCQ